MRYHRLQNENRSITGAVIDFYHSLWRALYDERVSRADRLQDYLYVIEFRAAGCDAGEFFEAFVEVNKALERMAYGFGSERHFGIAYLAKSPIQGRGLIRAIVMVKPEAVEAFAATAETLSPQRSGLSISKCEIDPLDPDAYWRWLAEGISASMYKFDAHRPRICILGEQAVVSVAPNEITALDFELIVKRWLQPQNTRRSAAIGIEGSSIPIH